MVRVMNVYRVAARAHVLNLEDQNLCMFNAPLAEWELQRTKIFLLVISYGHIFAV